MATAAIETGKQRHFRRVQNQSKAVARKENSRILVFPAASSPSINIRISLFPNILDNKLPIADSCKNNSSGNGSTLESTTVDHCRSTLQPINLKMSTSSRTQEHEQIEGEVMQLSLEILYETFVGDSITSPRTDKNGTRRALDTENS